MDIFIVDNHRKLDIMSKYLLITRPSRFGFDTETTVYTRTLSLLQICVKVDYNNYLFPLKLKVRKKIILNSPDKNKYICFLVYINKIHSKEFINKNNLFLKIMKDKSFVKLCCDADGDSDVLTNYFRRNTPIKGIIDIQLLVRSFGSNNFSLDKISNIFRLRKQNIDIVRVNFEEDNDENIIYAAYDSYLTLFIYNKTVNNYYNNNEQFQPPHRLYEKYFKYISSNFGEKISFIKLLNISYNFSLFGEIPKNKLLFPIVTILKYYESKDFLKFTFEEVELL